MPEIVDIKNLVEESSRQFRLQIEAGTETSVEEYTSTMESFPRLNPHERKRILGALIKIEFERNRRRGVDLRASDYSTRFPEFDRTFFDELITLPEIPPPLSRERCLPDQYRFVDEIGVGGIGVVWRVVDEQMKRSLAIKTLKPEFRNNWIANQRLRREAILTGGLQHPGIPPVYEQGLSSDGSQYFAMKLVEGNTLAEILMSEPRNGPALIGVFEQVAQTLAFAHSKGVIHRDVKPQNIMVGEFGEVQLMDWGMAKQLAVKNQSDIGATAVAGSDMSPSEAEVTTGLRVESTDQIQTAISSIDSSIVDSLGLSTQQGDVFGTPAYMSPEQARGNISEIDARSDVFGLGQLLFEILTGHRLFAGESAIDVLNRAAECDYGSVSQRLSDGGAEPALAAICCHCVQAAPDDRPDHAGLVADAIADYQLDAQQRLKQAEIDRTSALVQSSEQKKRARMTIWMSLLVAAVSLAGTIGFAWQSRNAIRSANQAQLELATRSEISDFFIFDFLETADPNVEPNRDLKVRTVLDRAATAISSRFQDRPEIETEIRLQLGQSYFGLGEYKAAGEQYSRVLELVSTLDGGDSDRAWDVRYKLGQVESGLGNDQQALEIFDRVHGVLADRHGEDSHLALQIQADRSSALTALGRFEEADQIALDLLSILEQHPVEGLELNALRIKRAVNLLELGNFETCREVLNQTMASLQDKIVADESGRLSSTGEMFDIFDYLNARMVEGNILELQAGDFSKAEELYQDLLVASLDLLGEKHSTTLEVINNLTIAMMRQGKFEEAKTVLEEKIPLAEDSIGVSSGLTIRLKNSLASCYTLLGETESAVAMFHSLEQTLAELHTEPHHNTIANNQNLGGLYYRLKKYELSEEYLSKALEDSKIVFGEEHPRTVVTLASIAKTHGALKHYELAEEEFLRSLRVGEIVMSADHPDNVFTLSDLCKLYMVSKQYDKAKSSLERLLKLRTELDGPQASSTLKTVGDLGIALFELREFGDSKPLLIQSHDYYANKYGPTHDRAITRFLTLVKTEIALEDFESAEKRLSEKLEQLDPENDRWQALRLESYLGKVRLGLGEVEQAETVLTNVFDGQTLCADVGEAEKIPAQRTTARFLIDVFEQSRNPEKQQEWASIYQSLGEDGK